MDSDDEALLAYAERIVKANRELVTENDRLEEALREARHYGEKMLRDRDERIQRCGADLLGILG